MEAEAHGRKLSLLERTLVLQYINDGNAPLLVFLEGEGKKPRSVEAIFPLAVTRDKFKILQDKGGPTMNALILDTRRFKTGQVVRVEVDFGEQHLSFSSTIEEADWGVRLRLPDSIEVIPNTPRAAPPPIKALLLFPGVENAGVKIGATVAPGFDIFDTPHWGDIVLEDQHTAKSYLDRFVADIKERKLKVGGGGVYLLSICRYFLLPEVKGSDVLKAINTPLEIIYCDSERIVFGTKNRLIELNEGERYMLQMDIATGVPSIPSRRVVTQCLVERVYFSDNGISHCAICSLEGLKEEDSRFLYERCLIEGIAKCLV